MSAFDECTKILGQCKQLPYFSDERSSYAKGKSMSVEGAMELAEKGQLVPSEVKKAYLNLAIRGYREGERLFSTAWIFNMLGKIKATERRRR